MTQCTKIMANVGNVFLSNVYKRFFLFSPRFLRFLTFFNFQFQFNFHLNVYHIYDLRQVRWIHLRHGAYDHLRIS